MIGGLARAGRIFVRPDWLAAARRALAFVQATLWRDGRLLATARHGRAHLPGYLDDYAFLLLAIQELLEADPRPGDLEFAGALADALLDGFGDPDSGGFHFTARDQEALIHRPKPGHDNSMPGGNAAAALALLRLGRTRNEPRYIDAAERTLQLFRPQLAAGGGGTATLLMALAEALHPAEPAVNGPGCSDVSCPVPGGVLQAS